MLNAIVRHALKYRGIVLALSLLFLGYGVFSLSQAKSDVFPEFAPLLVEIQTEAPGLAPEQVEMLVTQPLENALNGIPGLVAIHSTSLQGVSVITMNFEEGGSIYRDRQAVAERLSGLAGSLPQGAGAPTMAPLTSSTGDLMSIGFVSDKMSLMDLRTLVEWTVKPRILAVQGVAKASLFGGQVRQIQIQVKPGKLVDYDLSIDDILSAAQRATGVRGAGFIDTAKQRIILRVEGQAVTPQQLEKTSLTRPDGSISVTLGDVARVVEAPAPAISAATVMGRPAVVMNLWSQYGANTLDTTRGVDQALAELQPALARQGVTVRPDLFRASKFIDTALHNIRSSLLLGAGLVIVVLFVFLMDVRTAFISCTAIPLSLLAAVVCLQRNGLSLNTMTLGGLAIAIGEVVDDAVIDVENILRRLRENRSRPQPLPAADVVLHASLEVRSAVVYATFAVCLVFVPILTMSGLAGRLFGPLGLAYIFSILASLAVALTLTPALCLVLMGHRKIEVHEPPLVRWLKSRYVLLLNHVERHPWIVLGAVAAFTALGLGLAPLVPLEFLPPFHEGHFIVHMTLPPGSSIGESLRVGDEVTQALTRLPIVRSVAQRVGRAAVDDTYGPEESELEVDLKPLSTREADTAEERVRAALEPFKEADFEVNTFLTERIEETLSGYTSAVVVNLFGKDLDVLDQKADEALKAVRSVPGAADARIQSPEGVPQILVRLRPAALLRWGFDPVSVLDAVSVAYQGRPAGQVYQGNEVFDLTVVLDPAERKQPSDLGDLRIRNPAGTYVRLSQLADIQPGSGRSAVLHEAAQRVQTVTCNVSGRAMSDFMTALKKALAASVSLPPGYYLAYEGASAAQEKSSRELAAHSLMAAVGIVLLLSVVTVHWRNTALLLLNLPMALVGGVLVVLITRRPLSIGGLVGFVTLFGITLRNSIMMISHFEHLIDVEGLPWNAETAIHGASDRLTPVLMTALVTALGLLPLALGSGAAGREIEGPMALVILGGLVTSTALNLIALPTLALRFGRFGVSAARADARSDGRTPPSARR